MTSRRARLILLCGLIAITGCDDSFEPVPRVPPADESLWLLVGLQLRLDGLRSYLEAHGQKSFTPTRIDELRDEVLATTEFLMTSARSDEDLKAARYRLDLVAVAYGLIQVDAVASRLGVGGAVHASTQQGMRWVNEGLQSLRKDPRWLTGHPVEANRALLSAVEHRDNARAAVPFARMMKVGVHGAALTGAAVSLLSLTRTGMAIFGRLTTFMKGAGADTAFLGAEFAGGAGTVRLVATGGGTLILTAEEALALAKAGLMSAAAITVFMAASDLHHIATDKNWTSDSRGGPWSPRFEEIFKKAGMTLDDPANLVRVPGHRGPHPEEYHEVVLRALREETKGISPHTELFRNALKRALARLAEELQTPGSRLNRMVTGQPFR